MFINHTSIAVLCILNIDQLDNEFNLQFTGPQNPLVQMQSIPYLSKLQQKPLRTIFAGSDILYLSCSHSVLEEYFDSLSAITSATTWPSPPVGLFVCVSYPVATICHILLNLLLFLHCWQKYVKSVHWKNSNAPSQSVRIKSVLYFLNLEKIKVWFVVLS